MNSYSSRHLTNVISKCSRRHIIEEEINAYYSNVPICDMRFCTVKDDLIFDFYFVILYVFYNNLYKRFTDKTFSKTQPSISVRGHQNK